MLQSLWYKPDWAQRVVVDGSCPAQRLVTSRAAQGSVLGPVLVNIFVSDPEEVTELTAIRFAAHSKMVGALNTLWSRAAVQGDLDRLKERADRCLMNLNKDKCKILQLERNNPYNTGGGAVLRTLPCGCERVRAEQKPAVVLAAKTARSTWGCMNRSPMTTAPLYSALHRLQF